MQFLVRPGHSWYKGDHMQIENHAPSHLTLGITLAITLLALLASLLSPFVGFVDATLATFAMVFGTLVKT